MSRKHILLLLALGLCMPAGSLAQTASAVDLFNQAAREYVQVDRMTALRTLDKGLRAYPGDARLLQLAEELLKDQQQEQQQEQQEKQQQEQQQQQQEQEQQQQEQQQQQQQQQEQQDQGRDQEKQQEQGATPRPDQMNEQDARRILDALNQQEKDVQEKALQRMRPAVRRPIEKDW